jgi:hypothetical protein
MAAIMVDAHAGRQRINGTSIRRHQLRILARRHDPETEQQAHDRPARRLVRHPHTRGVGPGLDQCRNSTVTTEARHPNSTAATNGRNRRIQQGLSTTETMRCLKRYIAREIYTLLTT